MDKLSTLAHRCPHHALIKLFYHAHTLYGFRKLWKTALAEIELSVSRVAFHTQFKGSSLVSLVSGVATVGISNAPLRALVESRYYSLIKSILDHHTNQNISLVFVVSAKHERMTDEDAGPLFLRGSGCCVLLHRRPAGYRPEASYPCRRFV